MKCPECGKFVKNARAKYRIWDDQITKVTADCKIHGKVEPTDWEYEDFFGEYTTGEERKPPGDSDGE